MTAYTPAELMASVAARELRDGEVVFVGIGLPNLACNLARATHAPRLLLIYESGAVGAEPERLPVSIGDPALVTGSLMVCGMADVFQGLLQNGRIEVGFLGGAQIDRFGNINTTVVGSYARPKVRLPGSGGAAEIAIHARRTLVVSRLSKRAFPAEVDFITSPGHRMKGRDRRRAGAGGDRQGDPRRGPRQRRAGARRTLPRRDARRRPGRSRVAASKSPRAGRCRPSHRPRAAAPPRGSRPAATLPLQLTRDP